MMLCSISPCSATPTPIASILIHSSGSAVPFKDALPCLLYRYFLTSVVFLWTFTLKIRSDCRWGVLGLFYRTSSWCFFPVKSALSPWPTVKPSPPSLASESTTGNTQHPRPWCFCTACDSGLLGGYSYERVTITTVFWLALPARELTGASSNVSAGRA